MSRNILKRIISIILASFICTHSVFAEGVYNINTIASIDTGNTLTTISVGEIETTTENEIVVPINISNNVGLTGLTISIGYDSDVLNPTNIQRGEALSTLAFTKPRNFLLNPIKLLWDGVDADTSNGNIVLLTFTIANNVESAENFINVSIVSAYDDDLEDVEIIVYQGISSSNFEIGDINGIESVFPKSDVSIQTNQVQNSMPVSSILTVTSNIKLNGINVGENGMRIIDDAYLSCTFTVSNSSSDDKVVAMLATYTSEGILHTVQTYEIDTTQNSSQGIEYRFDAEKDHSGKLIFWNVQKNLMPIRATIDFTQNSGINAYYYNADNRLLQIDKANGKSVYFTYDNMGNLLSKSVNGGE